MRWWLALALLACGKDDDTDTGDTGDTGDTDTGDTDTGTADETYWDAFDRAVATTPHGHRTAVVCHNCYVEGADPAESLAGTLDAIHAAQAAGADVIELDVKEEGGSWIVDHEDAGATSGALLADVLADAALLAGDQPLFIELKETTEDAAAAADLLALVGAYAVEGRPVVFRAFDDGRDANLAHLAADHVRTHLLYQAFAAFDAAGFRALVDAAAAGGHHGVELSTGAPGLAEVLPHARGKGLAAGVWTLPESTGTALCAGIRDLVDVVVTDSPVAECRAAIEADNSLAHADVWDATDPDLDGVPIDAGMLVFTGSESLDLGTASAGAVMLTTVVDPDDAALATGATMPIAGNGAFDLSLRGTDAGNELVLSASVGGTEHEAVASPSRVGAGRILVVGFYDGTDLRLILDFTASGITAAEGIPGSLDAGGAWTAGGGFIGQMQLISVQSL